jgi:hypothetical protein
MTDARKMPPNESERKSQAQDASSIEPGMFNARDNWMRAILSDNDLSLTTRVVGCYFGTFVGVTYDEWPDIRRDRPRHIIKTMAAAIGLPTRVVAHAFATLFRHGYIYRIGPDYSIWLPKAADDATGDAS